MYWNYLLMFSSFFLVAVLRWNLLSFSWYCAVCYLCKYLSCLESSSYQNEYGRGLQLKSRPGVGSKHRSPWMEDLRWPGWPWTWTCWTTVIHIAITAHLMKNHLQSNRELPLLHQLGFNSCCERHVKFSAECLLQLLYWISKQCDRFCKQFQASCMHQSYAGIQTWHNGGICVYHNSLTSILLRLIVCLLPLKIQMLSVLV